VRPPESHQIGLMAVIKNLIIELKDSLQWLKKSIISLPMSGYRENGQRKEIFKKMAMTALMARSAKL